MVSVALAFCVNCKVSSAVMGAIIFSFACSFCFNYPWHMCIQFLGIVVIDSARQEHKELVIIPESMSSI